MKGSIWKKKEWLNLLEEERMIESKKKGKIRKKMKTEKWIKEMRK